MRTLLCAALFASLTAVALPAHAGRLLDVAVVDRDTGATLPTYADHGKLYVAGTPGHRYAVRLANRSGGRVLAVLSVDGVNAVSGETASADQTGYVLDAWGSTEIGGWRKNLDEVAQFNFTALPNSYAARTGRPANVGVIGVAVFTEREQVRRELDKIASAPPARGAADPRSAQEQSGLADNEAASGARPAAAPSPSMKARAPEQPGERIGTGHGARELAHVDTTTFERSTTAPLETLAVYYDSYANLVAQGIVRRPVVRTDPQPFPNGFAPDPASR